jgi:hypothetical protein
MVLALHLFDEVDGCLGDTRFPLPFPRFASPTQAKQVSVPAHEGVRLDDVQRVLPVPGEASQQHKTSPVAVRQFRSLDLPPEDDQFVI